MPVRRKSDPLHVHYVWDAIRIYHSQKQMADSTRIIKHLQKELDCIQEDAELYLKQTLEDEFILEIHKVTTTKGANRVGNEVDTYRIPQEDPKELVVRDGHDWYCFDCHLAGDVILCLTCHRVFHANCSKSKRYLSKLKGVYQKSVHRNSTSKKLTNKNLADSNASTVSDLTTTWETSTEDPLELETSENNHPQNGKIQNCVDECYDEEVCSVCNMCRTDPELNVAREELNYMLKFTFDRIKTWVPDVLTDSYDKNIQHAAWYTEDERQWRSQMLWFEDISMPIISKKLECKEYNQPYEFKADMLSLQHNIAVYHGEFCEEYEATKFLMEDCFHDISEIFNCFDCYKYSNEKIDENWFCIPCRNPHTLVWAKEMGHQYWPAKVLSETETTCDVRFFGGKHERSFMLSKQYIKPIDTNMNKLNIKKKYGFPSALKELALHQKLLKDRETGLDGGLQSNIENETSKQDNDRSSRKRKSRVIPLTLHKTQKRSHSVDKLSEKTQVAKTAKRRNSSAVLNITSAPPDIATTSDQNENPTSQSIQKQATTKKRKKKPAVLNTYSRMPKKIVTESSSTCKIPLEECSNGNSEVTSSSETIIKMPEEICSYQEVDTKMPLPERQYSESVEKTRRKLEDCTDKDELIRVALECMQAEIDKISNEHDVYIKRIFAAQEIQISETKKKQWCYNCEQDAIYHCCWNTAYCSITCQQKHWQTEHKKVCRRKR